MIENVNRIFLGGTCAETTWRDELIEKLKKYDVEWFNPVVKDWTPECQAIEEDEKNNKCNVHLYVITPEMQGTYSIAEIVNSAWQANCYGPNVNMVCFFYIGEWEKHQIKSFDATIRLCKDIARDRFIGCKINDLKEIITLLRNSKIC